MASYIHTVLKPQSVLEFGCGLGLYLDYLKRVSNIQTVYGIEPVPMHGVFDEPEGPRQFAIDIFGDVLPPELNEKFDLVMSVEVAEHIPRNLHDELFDFLVSRANNWVVFSAARVGQAEENGGHGHIAERPEHEWRDELVNRGMDFLEGMTKELRAESDKKNINHCRNLMVFRNPQHENQIT